MPETHSRTRTSLVQSSRKRKVVEHALPCVGSSSNDGIEQIEQAVVQSSEGAAKVGLVGIDIADFAIRWVREERLPDLRL